MMSRSTPLSRVYIGEICNQKRDGYGIYNYENRYFKYEGNWRNGLKHGQGRLLMKDGTYYEGQFQIGEITGQGFKYFACTGARYTGEFEKGELHGDGIMIYKDGSEFNGEWVFNRRQGYGVLKASDNVVYKGAFYDHLRHGEGSQTYENGDRYEGGWVMDKRDGFGIFHGVDGTSYRGQWKNDKFHGDGRIEHCSGFIYEGMWHNGYPTCMATKLVVIMDQAHIEIDPGEKFSIRVECRNEKDEIINLDQGRNLQIIAGFKYTKPQPGSSLFDLIEDMADKPLLTPFGYEVVPYPLTEHHILLEEEAPRESDAKTAEDTSRPEVDTETNGETISDGKVPGELEAVSSALSERNGVQEIETQANIANEDEDVKLAKEEEKSDIQNNDTVDGDGNPLFSNQNSTIVKENSDINDNVEWRPLPQPQNQRSAAGTCEWVDIVLAPPPPIFRAFTEVDSGPKNIKPKNVAKDNKTKNKLVSREQEYVIIVQEVSYPPFMERVLTPAFVLLKIKKPKRYVPRKEPKPKWDTSKHISSMSRITGEADAEAEDI